MKRLFFALLVLALAGLVLGVGRAWGYGDGPSPAVDPGQLVTYPSALAGLGDTLPTFDPTDVAIAGIPDTAVGIDSAPAVSSSFVSDRTMFAAVSIVRIPRFKCLTREAPIS